jgi:hypothetical protein
MVYIARSTYDVVVKLGFYVCTSVFVFMEHTYILDMYEWL